MSGQTGQLSFTELGDRLDAMYEIMNMNTSRRQVAVGLYGGFQVSSVKVRMAYDSQHVTVFACEGCCEADHSSRVTLK